MGAGVAKSPPNQHSEEGSMSVCDSCSAKFTPFKRKKCCFECGRHYCSSCTQKVPENTSQRRCTRCHHLVSGHFTRKDLENYKAKELQQFLTRRKVSVQNCREKTDFVDLVMRFSNNDHYQAEQREHERHLQSLQRLRDNLVSPAGADTSAGRAVPDYVEIPSPPRYNTLYNTQNRDTQPDSGLDRSTSSAREQPPTATRPPVPPPQSPTVPSAPNREAGANTRPGQSRETDQADSGSQPTEQSTGNQANSGGEPSTSPKAEQKPPFMKLSHIESLESIKHLSTRQLKEILSGNFVDYKGCVEKAELIQRVERLYAENEANKKAASEIEDTGRSATGETELCKICMDHVVDCVLLECGHMLTCTQCGKQLAECPICRQYVVRVVHVFKA